MKRITNLPAILMSCLVASMAIYLFSTVGTAHAAQKIMADIIKSEPGKISGKVTDVITAGGLTYAEVDTGKEKIWAAGPSATSINKGDNIAFSAEMPMRNFHSKRMGRDFSVIYFVKEFITDKGPDEVKAGDYLREASLDGLNVETKTLSSFKGKPLIINMWASYCGPCRAEMDSLERLAQKYNGKAFNIIGITIDDYRDKAEAFIKETGITFENFQDHNLQMEQMLGATFIPLTVLVDEQGRLLKKINGARPWDNPRIIAVIEQVFQIKLTE